MDDPESNLQHASDSSEKRVDSHVSSSQSRRESIWLKWRRIWLEKTAIDLPTAKLMFKGALAPTIGLAAYQATPWAEHFTTLGYLIPIVSILSIPIMPRAKFVQNMIVNVVATCTVCSMVLLAMFCGIKARQSTRGESRPGTGGAGTSGLAATGAQTASYSSSASAVVGVWLFILSYLVGAIRAKMPQFVVPSVIASIFVVVGMTYGPQFSTMTQAEAFASRLLETFLTGFALATGVSLLVFPLNSRQVVFKQMSGYINCLQACVSANMAYMQSMESTDMFAPYRVNTAGEQVEANAAATTFEAKIRALSAIHAKLATDITFAKREIAFGRIGPDDIQAVFRSLRAIMVPTTGLGSISDLFKRISEERGWDRSRSFANISIDDVHDDSDRFRIESISEWHSLISALREPFGRVSQLINSGLLHSKIVLQLEKPSQCQPDDATAEEGKSTPQPGSKEFRDHFDRCSQEFLQSKTTLLKAWCRLHSIDVPDEFFTNPGEVDFPAPPWMNDGTPTEEVRQLRRQLYLCLYMEFLLYTISRRVFDLILLVEDLQSYGKLSRSRLIVPGLKRLRKWGWSLFSHEAEGQDETVDAQEINTVYMGAAYKEKRDPEHLQPVGVWQKSGDYVRQISHFFASPASAFGFRVACAVISLGIISLLHDTQVFFTRNRLFWASIMISISMSPTSGQSLRNFFLRCAGTIVFYIVALIAYYIVDGHTAGILVFLGFFMMIGPYILLKHPAYAPVGMIGPITMVLIIGYELQVRKVGLQVAQTNGQTYHPIYTLGLIRVATVCGGCFVAWIFTIFPYPITEHAQLRQSLGRSLYLMANYYSITHERFRGCLRGEGGESRNKTSAVYRLNKSRLKVFSKTTVLLSGLRMQMSFMKFDIPIGGRFPKEQYAEIIQLLQNMLNSMALIAIASASFGELRRRAVHDTNVRWILDLNRLVHDAKLTSQSITTLLALMSASISNGQALPPYLVVPEPAFLANRLDELDRDILSVRHIVEPGYAAFAVTQICMRSIVEDLRRVLELVKELVGELDFSFHIVSTTDASTKASKETLGSSVVAGATEKEPKRAE